MESEDWSFGASVAGGSQPESHDGGTGAECNRLFELCDLGGERNQRAGPVRHQGQRRNKDGRCRSCLRFCSAGIRGSGGRFHGDRRDRISIAVTIYNDSTAFYLDVSGKAGDDNLDTQVKISYENILGLISGSGMVPGPDTMRQMRAVRRDRIPRIYSARLSLFLTSSA